MKATIIVSALIVILIGVLSVLSGEMAGFIALIATLAFGLGITAVLYLKFKPREKRVDTFNPLSPTLRWMNTAGSILLAANESADFRYLGGYGYRVLLNGQQQSLRRTLWDYWGIQSHDTALEEMRSLLTEGMRAQYKQDMERLALQYQMYTEEQLVEEVRKIDPNADEDSYLPKMLLAWRRYGENALLGWDMGRCAFIIQWCYLSGYVDMQEMLDIAVDAGRKAQKVFQNWEEMMESYLLGVQYWQHEDKNAPGSMTAERWGLYEKLWKGQKPFRESPYVSTPFELRLSKEIITDRYGVLPEYQKYYHPSKN